MVCTDSSMARGRSGDPCPLCCYRFPCDTCQRYRCRCTQSEGIGDLIRTLRLSKNPGFVVPLSPLLGEVAGSGLRVRIRCRRGRSEGFGRAKNFSRAPKMKPRRVIGKKLGGVGAYVPDGGNVSGAPRQSLCRFPRLSPTYGFQVNSENVYLHGGGKFEFPARGTGDAVTCAPTLGHTSQTGHRRLITLGQFFPGGNS